MLANSSLPAPAARAEARGLPTCAPQAAQWVAGNNVFCPVDGGLRAILPRPKQQFELDFQEAATALALSGLHPSGVTRGRWRAHGAELPSPVPLHANDRLPTRTAGRRQGLKSTR